MSYSISVSNGAITFNIIGVNDTTSLSYNISPNATGVQSIYWASIPANGDYYQANQLGADIGSSFINQVSTWIYGNQTLSTCGYNKITGQWTNSFAITPGMGVYLNVVNGKLVNWQPKLVAPR